MAKTDILPNNVRRVLAHGGPIVKIEVEEGKPGGANNDVVG